MLTKADLQKIKILLDENAVKKEKDDSDKFATKKEFLKIGKGLKSIRKDLKQLAKREDLRQFAIKDELRSLRGELKQFATREDLKSLRNNLEDFAKKDDLANLRQDLKQFATKDDLKEFAKKADLEKFVTKDNLDKAIEEIIEFVGISNNELKEAISEIKTILIDHQKKLDNHEIRIKNLEVN